MMTQTLAVFVDAYRELNARRLFWLSLGISFVIVAAFAGIGPTPTGVAFFGMAVESPVFNASLFPPSMFYRYLFVNLGVNIWLTWVATILALVSTAGMIPEFIASGSVELSLSKPIGRVRLFLTKYAAGLIFAAMQVTVFSIGAFIVLGWRGGTWDTSVFLAIPLVVLFFSFLYCVCALLGLVTRSTIASILITLVVWFVIFIASKSEMFTRMLATTNQIKIEQLESTIEMQEKQNVSDWQIAPRREELERMRQVARRIDRFETGTAVLMTILPKTSETIGLLERALFSEEEMLNAVDDNQDFVLDDGERIDAAELQRRQIKQDRERSPWWIIGTSLGFEAVVLGVACVIFARRDF